MESLGHEVVPFEDVVCQMWDMLKLGNRSYVTLQVRRFTRRHSYLSEHNMRRGTIWTVVLPWTLQHLGYFSSYLSYIPDVTQL